MPECTNFHGTTSVLYLLVMRLTNRSLFNTARTIPEVFHGSQKGSVCYRIPETLRDVLHGKRVLLVDDAVNAGSAWRSTLTDLLNCRAELTGFATLLTLGDAAAQIARQPGVPLITLASLGRGMWVARGMSIMQIGDATH
jgi:hypothetical protein